MSDRLRPIAYTESEGTWLEHWTSRHVTEAELQAKQRAMAKGQSNIWIEGIKVHAFIFADGRAWDTSNGWREGTDWRRRFEDAISTRESDGSWQ